VAGWAAWPRSSRLGSGTPASATPSASRLGVTPVCETGGHGEGEAGRLPPLELELRRLPVWKAARLNRRVIAGYRRKACLETRKDLKHLTARGRFGTRRCLEARRGATCDRDRGIELRKSGHGARCCHQRVELVRAVTFLRRICWRRGAVGTWLAARASRSRTLAEPVAHSGSAWYRFHQCHPAATVPTPTFTRCQPGL
jgi:hypothetical protein